MKKTLIASAVAAATFSGAALAQESNLPTVYGNIQLAVVHSDVDGDVNGQEVSGSDIGHYDNGSTLGVMHDHEIAPGIKGFFKAELEFDADDKNGNNGLDSFDEAYIGIEGDQFGRVWVGSDDSTYETAIDEIANYFEYAALNLGGLYDTGEGDLIQYSSPSFGGLKLHGAVQVNGDGDNPKKSYPYQLAATYAVDNLELGFAVDSNDGDSAYSDAPGTSINNENTYGVRASFNADNLRLTGQIQTRKDVGDIYGVMGIYTLGANAFALAYEYADADGVDANASTITAQAMHNLSDNMYVFVEGYLGNNEVDEVGTQADVDQTDVAIGAVYYF